jgi:hypothetical protein
MNSIFIPMPYYSRKLALTHPLLINGFLKIPSSWKHESPEHLSVRKRARCRRLVASGALRTDSGSVGTTKNTFFEYLVGGDSA